MSHSAHNLGTGWVQATIDKANASRETALFASVPLLVVVSERTLNIVDAVQVCLEAHPPSIIVGDHCIACKGEQV